MPKRKTQADRPRSSAPGEPEPLEHEATGPGGPEDGLAEPAADATEPSEAGPDLLEQVMLERDDALAARQRALADLVNFQRRAEANEHRAVQTGAARVVRSILAVLDHFDLALDQDPEQLSVEQLIGGVRIVHDDLLKALQSQGVERIEPLIGDEFDPNRHEAVMRQPSDEAAPNTIVSVLSPGYTMGDLVLRPAKVAVAAAEEG